MTNVIDFKKKLGDTLSPDERYVCIVINKDGSDAFIEHHEKLNEYEVLGMLEVAKAIVLSDVVDE